MKIHTTSIALAATLLLSPVFALAGPCDARFSFDGNLVDAEGNVAPGRMITKGGEIAKPVFVEGRTGQALSFDGTTAMRVMHDLHFDVCPQVTISAWVNISTATPSRTQYLLSTGAGSGPGIRVSGTSLALNGPNNGLHEQRAIRPGGGWQFVAGVYDFDKKTYALYRGNRKAEVKPMNGASVEWEEAFWVGAMNDGLSGASTGILIDDVRIIGSTLTYEEISRLKLNEFEPSQTPASNDSSGRPGMTVGRVPDGDPDLGGRNILPGAPSDDSDVTADAEYYGDALDNRDDAIAGAGILPEPEAGGTEPASTPPPESSGGETSTVPANLKPTPVGDRQFSAVSGFSGQNQKIIDLRDRFANGIHWGEAQNRPCHINVKPLRGEGETVELELAGCGAFFANTFGNAKVVGLNSRTAIGSISVCHNDQDNHRLKGIRVVGNRIESDGTTNYEPSGDAAQAANCRAWSTQVLCPGISHATGLVVHSNTSAGNNDEIVGLQLVCRNIGMR